MSLLDTVTTSATQAVNQATALGSNLSATFQQGVGAVQSSVQGLATNLNNLGVSVETAITGGIKTVTDKFKSEFANLPKPPSAPSVTPQQMMSAKKNNSGDHVFPPDIGDYFILFSFYEYDRPTATVAPKKKKTMSVSLPLPQNLTESFLMQYEQVDIGQLATMAQNAAQGGLSSAAEGMDAKEIGKAVAGSSTGQAIVRKAIGADLAKDATNAAQISGGFAPNPHIGLMFKGVNIRAPHQFTYRLSPKNEKESIQIREIVRKLKYVMHPARAGGSLNFNYPDLCDITITRPRGEDYLLYKFKPCFLESMNVNYAPNGVPTFFAGTRHPTDIEITMVFKEAQIFTREDFTEEAVKSVPSGG